jgi:hypothetical protein
MRRRLLILGGLLAGAVAIIAVALLAVKGTPSMTTQPSDAVTPLLEIDFTRVNGSPTGLRVFADGRYEQLGDRLFDTPAASSATTHPAPLEWRPVITFSADELNALRQAIADADFPALQPHYAPAQTIYDGGTMTWRVDVGGRRYEVAVEGYPVNRVPPLDALFDRLSRLRKLPPSRSEWQVWVDGRVERRSVNCDVSGVAALRSLVRALLAPAEPAAGATPVAAADLPDVPAATPLVDVLWQEQGRPDERTVAYIDGRGLSVVDGKTTLLRTLSGAQLATLLRAGARIDWAALPDPVCG